MTAATLASLILLGLSPPATDVDIRGTTSCPTPGEVLDRLRPLLSGRGGLPAGTWLHLADAPADPADAGAPAEVEVRLERANDPGAGTARRIARSGSCAETADIVAVVLASWGSLFSPVPVAPAAPPPAPRDATALVGSPARGAERRLALGAAAGFVATSVAGLAPVIDVDLQVPLGGAAAARVAVAGVGERETAFATVGRVAWRRILLLPALALTWRSPTSGSARPFAAVSAGPLAGLFFVQGRGFATNDHNVTLDLGGAAGARVGLRLAGAAVAFWLGADAWFYARRQDAWADGVPQTLALPWWDLAVTAGLAWAPGS